MSAPAPITSSTSELLREMREEQASSCPRIELVVAIHDLASNFENTLGAFRDDTEARRKAEGDIAYAMKVAARHNYNGPGCASLAPASAPQPASQGEVPMPRPAFFDDHSIVPTAGLYSKAQMLAYGDARALAAVREPITHDRAIKLWHASTEAHSKTYSFGWFAEGIRAAELEHGITAQAQQEGK